MDIERWIAYRSYEKYDVIRVDGVGHRYADKDEQLLGAVFGLLVDYVEIELANLHWACDDRLNTGSRRFLRRLLPWRKWRSAADGLAHLELESSLTETAAEIKILYLWWKDLRPLRRDPMEESGAYAAHDVMVEDPERWHAAALMAHQLEEAQHAEDQRMLHRVIEIRRCLWS